MLSSLRLFIYSTATLLLLYCKASKDKYERFTPCYMTKSSNYNKPSHAILWQCKAKIGEKG